MLTIPDNRVPSIYRAGYERAHAANPSLAAKYIHHALIGDPAADAVAEALTPFDPEQMHRLIQGGMEQDAKIMRDAPQPLRDFFDQIEHPPAWFDPASVREGCRAFHNDSDVFLSISVVGSIVRGFSTLIGKAFFMTGRITDHGARRLKQNLRHLVEITLPGGLERQGDGWKLSVRIRLVHAQARRLLRNSDNWDEAAYGMPISAAHLAFSSTLFCAWMLQKVESFGVRPSDEARASYMQIWRYTAFLFGVPETILFRDEAEAMELYRIASFCEPQPDVEEIAMANSVIHAVPLVLGMTDPDARRAKVSALYRVSRVLIGNALADALRFPSQRADGTLAWVRWQRRLLTALDRLVPQTARKRRAKKFTALLDTSMLEDAGIIYRLPDHLSADQASPW